MADFTPTILSTSITSIEGKKHYYFVGVENSPTIFRSGDQQVISTYIQRIYDTSLNQYCYYKLSFKTATPQSTQTTPNHTGNLDDSTHEIIALLQEVV